MPLSFRMLHQISSPAMLGRQAMGRCSSMQSTSMHPYMLTSTITASQRADPISKVQEQSLVEAYGSPAPHQDGVKNTTLPIGSAHPTSPNIHACTGPRWRGRSRERARDEWLKSKDRLTPIPQSLIHVQSATSTPKIRLHFPKPIIPSPPSSTGDLTPEPDEADADGEDEADLEGDDEPRVCRSMSLTKRADGSGRDHVSHVRAARRRR